MPPTDAAGNVPRGDVVLSHVTFGYDEHAGAVRICPLLCKSGEQVTLVGRTGAGKSTVFRLLLGLYQAGERRASPSAAWTYRRSSGQRAPRAASAVWSSTLPVCPARCWIRSRWAIHASRARRGAKRPRTWRGWTASSAPSRTGMTRPARTACFRRENGSCSPSPALPPQTQPCCCWTRSRPISTRKPRLACWRRCAARRKGRTVLSISHRVYETLGGRTIRIGEEA